MPISRKRKKKGQKGRPTQPRTIQTNLPQLLALSNELDRAEEELLLKQLEEIEEETPNAPE